MVLGVDTDVAVPTTRHVMSCLVLVTVHQAGPAWPVIVVFIHAL